MHYTYSKHGIIHLGSNPKALISMPTRVRCWLVLYSSKSRFFSSIKRHQTQMLVRLMPPLGRERRKSPKILLYATIKKRVEY